MWRGVRFGLVLVVGLLTGFVCSAGSRDKITPFPEDWPHRAPWKLNRELLTPQTVKIVFVVEVTRGTPPKESALDHLVEVAAKYGLREAEWIHADAPGAPKVRWVVLKSPTVPPVPIVHVSVERTEEWSRSKELPEEAWVLLETVHCPAGPLPEDTSFVFVRYLGEWSGGAYGTAARKQSTERCGGREFPVIYIAQNVLSKIQMPGFERDFLEPRDLVHEYGHVLGLGSNPAHARIGSTQPGAVGPHCVHQACAAAIPSTMALVLGRMMDYCDDCRHDIEQARQHWESGIEFPEVPRLEALDVAEFIAELKKYSFSEGGRAERVVHWGKDAVPPLIERIPDLPGSRDPSPKFYAVELVLRILATEDRNRRDDGIEMRYSSPRDDRTGALLRWWTKQGEAFMGGDDWLLPAGVLAARPADD